MTNEGFGTQQIQTERNIYPAQQWHQSQVETLTRDELLRSNRELEQFAFSASHDLLEPLAVTTMYAQLLERKYKGKLDVQADNIISSILDSTGTMRKLIQGLLNYARANNKERKFKKLDSSTVIRHAIENLKVKIEESCAVIRLGVCPEIEGNEVQLTQLFQNLIGNAIKYCPKDIIPIIHISVQEEDSQWSFSVRDNGIGIEPEHSEHIFEIYKRLHNQNEYSGNGIGLALCKGIVQFHNGKIWIESETGGGSTFYFTIPKKISPNV